MSRVQKKSASLELERDDHGFVVRALNGDLGEKAKGNRQILDPRALLVLVKRLQHLTSLLQDKKVPLFSRTVESRGVYSSDLIQRVRAINRFLERYTASPMIFPNVFSNPNSSDRGWRLEWARTRREHPFVEMNLVLRIVGIAQAGRISSLKQCEQCPRWFFARQENQRFCPGGKCQQEFHKFNEADKKRRRDWAKKNYQSRKELELGSRKASRHKGGKG
jgi:hypothetical protein